MVYFWIRNLLLHLTSFINNCFCQLGQLWITTRSISTGTATILVHSFVTTHCDFCVTFYSGIPSLWLACLDHIPRSAAHPSWSKPKFTLIVSYMLEVLYRLPAHQCIEYRIAFLVRLCQLGRAPTYLIDLCGSALGTPNSHSLSSAPRSESHLLVRAVKNCQLYVPTFTPRPTVNTVM